MKRRIIIIFAAILFLITAGCSYSNKQPHIVATTAPVYAFTRTLCDNTPLHVEQLVQENVSCLHDYTLTVKHMKLLENADLVIISGGGLEDFLDDALPKTKTIIDASDKITLHCSEGAHDHHDGHRHDTDPHYWLSIENAKLMANSICDKLVSAYPEYCEIFERNLDKLSIQFDQLQNYATTKLTNLNCRKIVTFHDGFSYMAEEFGLTILHAIEEEAGSEASAKDIIHICNLVKNHSLPAVFIEKNSSSRSANVICSETGAALHCLDMAMSDSNYFEAMYHNIDTLKEALG